MVFFVQWHGMTGDDTVAKYSTQKKIQKIKKEKRFVLVKLLSPCPYEGLVVMYI